MLVNKSLISYRFHHELICRTYLYPIRIKKKHFIYSRCIKTYYRAQQLLRLNSSEYMLLTTAYYLG